jgi:thioesterase domain-containing protein
VHTASLRGPYIITGYSFGGLVAYEMAYQLTREGEIVEQVLLLDTAIHPRFLPMQMRLRRRFEQAKLIRRGLQGQGGLGYLIRWLQNIYTGVRLRLGAQEVYLGDKLVLPPAMERVRTACGTAFIAYRPPRYKGNMTLLRARGRSARDPDSLSMWRRLAPRLQVEEIPGDHYSLIEEPAVEHVAAALLKRF